MELTILMPCLNEAETLAQCINKARSFLQRENITGEILIADNGSTDGSQTLAEKNGARLIHVAERGYGAALMAGIRAANGKFVIMGDADDSYDFANLQPFIEKLRSGCDLVMGNRFQGGIEKGAMPFLNKYLGNPVLSFLGRLFFKCPIGDFHCGLRGFNRAAILQLHLQAPGMEFASEMVVKAALNNCKICEVPTTLSPDGRSRPPHLRKWRDGWRHLRLLLSFSPKWLFFYPGILLASTGLILMSILTFAPIKIGGFAFDIHTLLFSGAFFIVGLQTIFLSAFSKIIANRSLNVPKKKYEFYLEQFTLEKGIVIGLLFILFGIAGSVFSLSLWMKTQFGPLSPVKMMRITIPSVTSLISGMQIIFAAFFMDLLMSSQKNKTLINEHPSEPLCSNKH